MHVFVWHAIGLLSCFKRPHLTSSSPLNCAVTRSFWYEINVPVLDRSALGDECCDKRLEEGQKGADVVVESGWMEWWWWGGRGISAAALSTCFNARRAAEILCRPPSSYLFCILTPLPLRPAFWTVLLTQSWCRLNIHLVGGHIHRREAIVFPRISYIKVVAARMAALYHHSLATSCPRWHLPVEASLTAFWLLVTSCLYSISPAFVRTAGRQASFHDWK